MIDICVIWTENNCKFEVRRLYDGFVFFKSRKHKTHINAWNKLADMTWENNWIIEREVHES